jgi:hypothetical protein
MTVELAHVDMILLHLDIRSGTSDRVSVKSEDWNVLSDYIFDLREQIKELENGLERVPKRELS